MKTENEKTDPKPDLPRPADAPRAWRWLFALIVAPVIAHGALLTVQVSTHGSIDFERPDMWVAGLVGLYLMAALYLARDRSRLKRLAVFVYVLLVSLGLMELALRAIFPIPPLRAPWPPNLKRVSSAGATMPGISGEIVFSTDSLGLRGPEVDLDQVDVRILAVGGSSTECLYVTDRLSWPWRLQDLLAKRLQRKVFVGNAGHSGHFTLHHAYLLEHYQPAPRFEWVLVKCGMNDMLAYLSRTYEYRAAQVPRQTLSQGLRENAAYYRGLVFVRILSDGLDSILSPVEEANQDPEGAWLTEYRDLRKQALQLHPLADPPPGLDSALDQYRKNLREIAASCRRHDQRLVFITQPTLYRDDLPPDLAGLILQVDKKPMSAFLPGTLAEIIAAFNRAMLETCEQEGLDCLDLAARLPKDTTVFYDDCHFNVSGCDQAAAIIADFIAPLIETAPADLRRLE